MAVRNLEYHQLIPCGNGDYEVSGMTGLRVVRGVSTEFPNRGWKFWSVQFNGVAHEHGARLPDLAQVDAELLKYRSCADCGQFVRCARYSRCDRCARRHENDLNGYDRACKAVWLVERTWQEVEKIRAAASVRAAVETILAQDTFVVRVIT